jgi:hypothetical protein
MRKCVVRGKSIIKLEPVRNQQRRINPVRAHRPNSIGVEALSTSRVVVLILRTHTGGSCGVAGLGQARIG